jgi:hypothetical protein
MSAFFVRWPQASKLLCLRQRSEKLFINSEKFILNYLKRCTDPVRIDKCTHGLCGILVTCGPHKHRGCENLRVTTSKLLWLTKT